MAKYRIYWWATVGVPTRRIRGHDDIDTDNPIENVAVGERLPADIENMVEKIKMTGELTEYQAEELLDLAADGTIFLGSFTRRYTEADACGNFGVVKVVRLRDKPGKGE